MRLWPALVATGILGNRPVLGAARLAGTLLRHGPTPYALLRWQAHQRPSQMALRTDGESLTFAQLDGLCRARMVQLRRHVGPGDVVGIAGRGGVPWITGMAAAARLGCTAVCMNTLDSVEQWQELCGRLGIRTVLFEHEQASRVARLPVLGIELSPTPSTGWLGWLPPRRGTLSILTSGTTGRAKAISRHSGINGWGAGRIGADYLTRLAPHAGDSLWIVPPLFHGTGMSALVAMWGLGGSLIVGPEPRDAAVMRDSLRRTRPDWILAVPTVLHRLVAQEGSLPPVRGVLTGGSAVSPELVRMASAAFAGRVFNLYGTTETGPISMATPDDIMEGDVVTVGRELDGVRVDLTDGVLTVASPLVAVSGGRHCTGDLVSRTPSGALHVTGRADDRFAVGAEKVDPAALEQRIESVPGVAACAVLPSPDTEYGHVVHAWIVADAHGDREEIEAALTAALPRTLRPRRITWMDRLPCNATGKVDKARLQQECGS